MSSVFDPQPPGDDCPDHGPHTGDCPKCAIDNEETPVAAMDELAAQSDD